MTVAVINAIRNAIDIALYVEAAGVESCPNAIIIRALNLCAMGDTLEAALAATWSTGLPVTTDASRVLQVAYDRIVCTEIEHSL